MCFLGWETNSEFNNNYDDSLNLTFKTPCSHNELTYYSFKTGNWLRLNHSDSEVLSWNISYTNCSSNREEVDVDNKKCVYQIITKEIHEHLQGITSGQSANHDACICYSSPLRYNVSTDQYTSNCNQETPEQTTVAIPSQDPVVYLSCRAIVVNEIVLPLFCLLMYLIFVTVIIDVL